MPLVPRETGDYTPIIFSMWARAADERESGRFSYCCAALRHGYVHAAGLRRAGKRAMADGVVSE